MLKMSDFGEDTGYDLDDIRSMLEMPTTFSSQYPDIIRVLCDEIESLRTQGEEV